MDRDSCFRQELPQSVKRPTPPAALQGDGEHHHGDADEAVHLLPLVVEAVVAHAILWGA